jgi:hypothetical protein
MKRQKSCGPRLGKLVHQLPGVVTFAYDLRFRRMIARWKDLSEDYNIFDRMKFCNIPQKTSFRASKRLQKFRTRKTAKNSKLPKMSERCFEPVGKGGWTPISIWIMAIMHALTKFRQYLVGNRFKVKTDHNSLKFLMEQKELREWQQKWISKIQAYDFEIEYVKGKNNLVVDALSRIPTLSLMDISTE